MSKKILILGASGNFGSKIAKGLAKNNIPIIIAGRQIQLLISLKNEIHQSNPNVFVEIACFDIQKELIQQLVNLKTYAVINTCGPFQSADYSIALNCINAGIHYIDLADDRDFVNGIHNALDQLAKENNCLVVSGASTVPCLSSAVLKHYKNQFSSMDSLIFGISPGQKTERGLATTQAILSYVGKPFKPIPGASHTIYGWQNLYRQPYPIIGKRWMANCEIPDLDLLPRYSGIQNIRFSAGIENSVLHLSLWALSWFVRLGLPIKLKNHAKMLLKLSHLFDCFGSKDGGMHMVVSGKGHNGREKMVKWFLIAKDGDGPHIPTIPAIILAKKLVQNKINLTGAIPCVGLILLEEYLKELNSFNIQILSEIY
ncbi:TPA: saccharopine dehydrogenase NADP-binding domain-containing protein [Legionella pneumophila]